MTSAAIAEQIYQLERPLLIALDIDGTLAPIVKDPDKARVPSNVIRLLETLRDAEKIELALVSGRDYASLNRTVNLKNVWCITQHGAYTISPKGEPNKRISNQEEATKLIPYQKWLDENASDALFEAKPGALALHVRQLAQENPSRAEQLLNEAEQIAKSMGLYTRRGRALCEASAIHASKAEALAKLFKKLNAKNCVYAGDDLTDFEAIEFAAAQGIGIFVRSDELEKGPENSTLTVEGTQAIENILQCLVEYEI